MNFLCMQKAQSAEAISNGYATKRMNEALDWLAKHSALKDFHLNSSLERSHIEKHLRRSLMEQGLKLAKEKNHSAAFELLEEASKIDLKLSPEQHIKLQRLMATCQFEQAKGCSDRPQQMQLLEASAQRYKALIEQVIGSSYEPSVCKNLLQVLFRQHNLALEGRDHAKVAELKKVIPPIMALLIESGPTSYDKAEGLYQQSVWQTCTKQTKFATESLKKARDLLVREPSPEGEKLLLEIENKLKDLSGSTDGPRRVQNTNTISNTSYQDPWFGLSPEQIMKVFPAATEGNSKSDENYLTKAKSLTDRLKKKHVTTDRGQAQPQNQTPKEPLTEPNKASEPEYGRYEEEDLDLVLKELEQMH